MSHGDTTDPTPFAAPQTAAAFEKLAEERIRRLQRRVERYNATVALGNSIFGTLSSDGSGQQKAKSLSPLFHEVDEPPPPPPPPRSSDPMLVPPTLRTGAGQPPFSSTEFDPEPLSGSRGDASSSSRKGASPPQATHAFFGAASCGSAFGVRDFNVEADTDDIDAANVAVADSQPRTFFMPDDPITFEEDASDVAGSPTHFTVEADEPSPTLETKTGAFHEPLDEATYHKVKLAAIAAEVYEARLNNVGAEMFTEVGRWSDLATHARNNRKRTLQEEPLLTSRQEETTIQLDEALRRAGELSLQLNEIATLRYNVEMNPFRAKEELIDAKRQKIDQMMEGLQKDLVMLERRRAHVAAIDAHNEAKAKSQGLRSQHLQTFRNETAAVRTKLSAQFATLHQREEKIRRWTEILSRREAAIAQRENTVVGSAHRPNEAAYSAPPPPPPSSLHHQYDRRPPLATKEELNVVDEDACSRRS